VRFAISADTAIVGSYISLELTAPWPDSLLWAAPQTNGQAILYACLQPHS